MTRTVFRGGVVFDGMSEPSEGDLVIEGERIVEVGAPGLDGDEEVDCSGSVVLPGLIDCHTHVTFSGDLDVRNWLARPFSFRYFEAVRNLELSVRTGLTTIREASGADLGVKQAVDTGVVMGPRMQISIAMLSQTGGHGDSHMPSGGCYRWHESYPGNPSGLVDGPENMRRRVRELIREGADVIKVATSGGVLSPRDDPRHGHFRDDELDVLVAEARAAGIFVMAHAQATEGIKSAVRAGIRSIEHGIYLDAEAIEMMVAAGTWLVPTLLAPRGVLKAAEAGQGVLEAAVVKTKQVLEVHSESFRSAVEAGVKVAMGTDSGVTPHGLNLDELALMVENSSMTAVDAWRATTSVAADLLGLSGEIGTLEVGKRADVALLSGSIDDLVGLGDRITGVWKDGRRLA